MYVLYVLASCDAGLKYLPIWGGGGGGGGKCICLTFALFKFPITHEPFKSLIAVCDSTEFDFKQGRICTKLTCTIILRQDRPAAANNAILRPILSVRLEIHL